MPKINISDIPISVSRSLNQAVERTGISFDYLAKTAARESAFKANAKASSSSATGLFQFIENTWLGMIKSVGHRYGLGEYAQAIIKDPAGRYGVRDSQLRYEILNLRNDAGLSAIMAGEFAQQNARYLYKSMGRQPTGGELYMAHFLGPEGARKMLTLAKTSPTLPAENVFSRQARANRAIFYEKNGEARNIATVAKLLTGMHDRVPILPGKRPDMNGDNARAVTQIAALQSARDERHNAPSPAPAAPASAGSGRLAFQTLFLKASAENRPLTPVFPANLEGSGASSSSIFDNALRKILARQEQKPAIEIAERAPSNRSFFNFYQN